MVGAKPYIYIRRCLCRSCHAPLIVVLTWFCVPLDFGVKNENSEGEPIQCGSEKDVPHAQDRTGDRELCIPALSRGSFIDISAAALPVFIYLSAP